MEWYEDPRRIHEAVRSAAWRGAWRMLGVIVGVLILGAILFPVFAQSKVGPKFGIDSVPGDIQVIHRESGRWPDSFADLKAHWRAGDHLTHRAAFLKLRMVGDEAEYAVAFDGRLGAYRIAAEGRPRPLALSTSGTLGP